MTNFEYVRPRSLEEALEFLDSHGSETKILAGGTDLVVDLRAGAVAPRHVLDVGHLPELKGIAHTGGEVTVGAAVTLAEIESSGVLKAHAPTLQKSALTFASRQIRNVATIGGNLVNAVPSADGAIPLIALDGKVRLYGPKGQRTMDLGRFFLGPGQCDVQEAEILAEIVIPPLAPRTGGAYVKHGRREAMELPMLGVGVLFALDEDLLTCTKARICLGVAAPTPFRALEAEKYLTGKPVTEEVLAEAGRIAGGESRVRDSIRGVAWYRREMVGVLVKRMGLTALERAATMEKRG